MEKSLNEPIHQVPWSSFRISIMPNVTNRHPVQKSKFFFGGKELLHALISEQASLVVTSSE